MNQYINKILEGDTLEVLKELPDESVDMIITSPPYWGLRDYGVSGQLGHEENFNDYIDKLIHIFNEAHRVLKQKGSCWVNIGDTYIGKKQNNVNKKSLACIPDRFKVAMVENGWVCRNEIIWHKPNAMPSSVKDRFNCDYEKMYFFTKNAKYYFETQYEEAKTTTNTKKNKSTVQDSKYLNDEQEKSVRQGMSKTRGTKLIEKRNLPDQQHFVDVLRENFTVDYLEEKTRLKRSTIEHWFRRDESGFSYPKKEDWLKVETELFPELLHVWYETDDINKNLHKGRIKRSVWSINTRPFKGTHFAPYPKELIETPIKACCPDGGIVLDPFMGSGTTGVVSLENNKKFIGIDLNPEYIEVAYERINNETGLLTN